MEQGDNAADQPTDQPSSTQLTCPHRKDDIIGRNLVVCIDGTANEFGRKNSNVIELHSLITKRNDDRQCTYYNSGIGTYARPSWKSLKWYKKVLSHKIDALFALHFEDIVLDAYRWLSETYKEGDRIFLFGFSRGAFQVRVLSAMIHKVGLINRGNQQQIPFAYQWYADPTSDPAQENSPPAGVVARYLKKLVSPNMPSEKDTIRTAEQFRDVFSRKVKVHFVGVWDTVSSVGLARRRQLLPGTIDGMGHVCYFRHALALDERRVKFLPEYAYGGMSQSPSRQALEESGIPELKHTKEVWFAGVHSDIGGGNIDNKALDNARPALRWMYAEAESAGLRLASVKPKPQASDDWELQVNQSLTRVWWPLEYLPLRHLTYTSTKEGKQTTRWPHRGRARIIQDGQTIHPSVWLSKRLIQETDGAQKYLPKAHLLSWNGRQSERVEFWKGLYGWEDCEADGRVNPWKEVDLDELMRRLVEQYKDRGESQMRLNDRKTMDAYASTARGWQALYRMVLHLLETRPSIISDGVLCGVLEIILEHLDARSEAPLQPYRVLRPQVLYHLKLSQEITNNQYRIVARQFLAHCTIVSSARLGDKSEIAGHMSTVTSVAFSSDSEYIVSGSSDHTIRIWNARTGDKVGRKPYRSRKNNNWTFVAFSPGSLAVIAGTVDGTLWLWGEKQGEAVFKFTPVWPDGDVKAVVFSPDKEHHVLVRRDERPSEESKEEATVVLEVYFTDQTKEKMGRLAIRDRHISAPIALSQGGKRVVVGLSDGALQTWDVQSGKALARLDMAGGVNSVAFSLDGSRIVTGSDDGTIQIWDANAKAGRVLERLVGHTSVVSCVAFSQDGQRVVAGTDEGTIRVWDVIRPL